jgi:hypothetical protein
MAVAAVVAMYQCAETIRTARGRGNDRATSAHASVQALCSSAFIGLPWPTNTAGIRVCGLVATEDLLVIERSTT